MFYYQDDDAETIREALKLFKKIIKRKEDKL